MDDLCLAHNWNEDSDDHSYHVCKLSSGHAEDCYCDDCGAPVAWARIRANCGCCDVLGQPWDAEPEESAK